MKKSIREESALPSSFSVPATAQARTVPTDSPGRWATPILLLLVLIPIAFNAVTLWPEVSRPVPSLNDDAVHYLFIQRASEALGRGENPFDHWLPEVELGFPTFFYYRTCRTSRSSPRTGCYSSRWISSHCSTWSGISC